MKRNWMLIDYTGQGIEKCLDIFEISSRGLRKWKKKENQKKKITGQVGEKEAGMEG